MHPTVFKTGSQACPSIHPDRSRDLTAPPGNSWALVSKRIALLEAPLYSISMTRSDRLENAHTRKAYDYIKDRILSGEFMPARRLQTLVLASDIGVSRSPVRDALRELHKEGLVEIRPRLGARVRPVNAVDAQELWEFRLALESFSAELAARNWRAEQLVEIQDSFNAMEQLVAALDTNGESEESLCQLAEQDIRFHFAILVASGNKLIRDEIHRLHVLDRVLRMHIVKRLNDTTAPAFSENPRERRRWVLECHRKILVAICNRDSVGARNAMHEHISEIVDRSIIAMVRAETRQRTFGVSTTEIQYTPYS